MGKCYVHIISHSHWDREGTYLLKVTACNCGTVDNLFDLLKNDPGVQKFHLDDKPLSLTTI